MDICIRRLPYGELSRTDPNPEAKRQKFHKEILHNDILSFKLCTIKTMNTTKNSYVS